MAELLVRTEDNTIPEDALMDLKSWKKGYVITVQENGWAWGSEELANPLFTIIKIPDMTVAQAGMFMGYLDNSIRDSGIPDKENPLRAFKVDLDHPTVFGAGKVKKGVRTKEFVIPRATFLEAKVAVDIKNPLIIS